MGQISVVFQPYFGFSLLCLFFFFKPQEGRKEGRKEESVILCEKKVCVCLCDKNLSCITLTHAN